MHRFDVFRALRLRAERLLFDGIMRWHLAKLAPYKRPFRARKSGDSVIITDAEGTVCRGLDSTVAWALNGICATNDEKKDEERNEESLRSHHRIVPLPVLRPDDARRLV